MRLSRFATGAFAAIALTTGGTAAHAQSFQEWTTCAPFETNTYVSEARTCFTTRLETNAILSGGVRTGTAVSMLLRNLQGTAAGASYGDNAPWSGIGDIVFYGQPLPTYDVNHFGIVPTLVGGATGTVLNDREAFTASYTTSFLVGIDDNDTPRTTVGGCAPRPGATLNYSPALFTCAATSWIDFSYTSAAVFDATSFDGFYAGVYRTYGASDTWEQCFTPGPNPFGVQPCTLEVMATSSQPQPDVTATPEPGTLGLFATALVLVPLGVGRSRRRGGRDA